MLGSISIDIYGIAALWGVAVFCLVMVVSYIVREALKSYEKTYSAETARHLDDMFLVMPAQQIFYIAVLCSAAAFLLAFLFVGGFGSFTRFFTGLLASCAAAAAAFPVPRLVLRWLKKQRTKKFNVQLVDALATMSNSLRAGFSIIQAFEMVVKEGRRPISEEFGLFLHQHRLGMRFEDALGELGKRIESVDLDLMIAAIETARQTGGNLTEVFDRLSKTIRERMRVEGKIQSLTALGRLQGRVVGLVVPVVLVAGMTYFNPRLMAGFLQFEVNGVPVGLLVVAGLAMWVAVGFWFIRKIVAIDV
jgi:tight adherence protein B